MSKPEPSNAPVYAAMYPELAKVVRECGYALAVHGSVARDFDLICVPWVKNPCEPYVVVRKILDVFALTQVGEPEIKDHGREVWTLTIGFGECFLDLSFTPIFGIERVDQSIDKTNANRLVEVTPKYEVYGYMWQHEETGNTGWVDQYQIDNGFEKTNPRLQVICPLYRKIEPSE